MGNVIFPDELLNTDFTDKQIPREVSGQVVYMMAAGADLSGVDFRGINLKNVIFSVSDPDQKEWQGPDNHSYRKKLGVIVAEVNLSNVDLSGKNLSLINFNGANLSGANLSNSDLRYSDLSGANLAGANLQYALLDNAILSNANLKCINHPICKSS